MRTLKENWQWFWFKILCWWTVKKLHISCKLWGWRGLDTCPVHGFHAQSWVTGKCRKCEVIINESNTTILRKEVK